MRRDARVLEPRTRVAPARASHSRGAFVDADGVEKIRVGVLEASSDDGARAERAERRRDGRVRGTHRALRRRQREASKRLGDARVARVGSRARDGVGGSRRRRVRETRSTLRRRRRRRRRGDDGGVGFGVVRFDRGVVKFFAAAFFAFFAATLAFGGDDRGDSRGDGPLLFARCGVRLRLSRREPVAEERVRLLESSLDARPFPDGDHHRADAGVARTQNRGRRAQRLREHGPRGRRARDATKRLGDAPRRASRGKGTRAVKRLGEIVRGASPRRRGSVRGDVVQVRTVRGTGRGTVRVCSRPARRRRRHRRCQFRGFEFRGAALRVVVAERGDDDGDESIRRLGGVIASTRARGREPPSTKRANETDHVVRLRVAEFVVVIRVVQNVFIRVFAVPPFASRVDGGDDGAIGRLVARHRGGERSRDARRRRRERRASPRLRLPGAPFPGALDDSNPLLGRRIVRSDRRGVGVGDVRAKRRGARVERRRRAQRRGRRLAARA